MIKKQNSENIHVLKLFQNVNTRWDSTCHMLIKALALRKALSMYHDKHEIEYLRLSDTEWSQVKYLIDLIKIFCVFTKTINQSKLSTIYQMFDIYDKLFDHLDRARLKLSRKKISWKRVMLEDLVAANAKLRQYYSKTQESLNCLYEKTMLLSSNKKNVVFQNSNWKVENKETSWNEIYWKVLKDQFRDEYHDESRSYSRRKQTSRINDLDILLNVDTSSFEKNQNEFDLYRKRDKLMTIFNSLTCINVIMKRNYYQIWKKIWQDSETMKKWERRLFWND
jgi:hypothetical protein